MKDDTYPKVVLLEGVLMENREFIHHGKTFGFISERQKELVEKGASKRARGSEIIIALGDNTA